MQLPFRVCLVAVFLLASTIGAAERPDFSGSYTLTAGKGVFKVEKGTVWTLNVVQTATSIEITKVTDGHQTSNRFPLDGGEGDYTSPGGARGTCTAHLKGKYLLLDSVVTTHPQPNGPAIQIHTREHWELSADSKTLTIRTDVDSPTAPSGLFDPWSEIYTRN